MDDFQNVILDDVSTPQETESVETEQQTDVTAEDTTNTDTQQEQAEQAEETPKVKLKYNHEEKEYSLDDVVPLAQKGLNYDKLQERLQSLESDPSRVFLQELAKQNGYSDVNQYIDAVRQWQEQERVNQLVQQNIPEEYAKEIMENRKFREQYETERRTKAEQEKQSAQFAEFIQAFPDVKAEDVSPEVWQMVEQGTPLRFAYLQHDYNQLKNQVQVLKQNAENSKRAPIGSVSAHGTSPTTDKIFEGFDD